MKDAVHQGGEGEDEADERAGSADVEEGASGANGGAHENESAECADEGRKGNEERIAGVDMVVTAGEEMAEFVGEKNGEKSGGEGKACKKGGGILVEEREGAEELVEGSGLIAGIGDSELGPGGEAGAEGEEKEGYSEDEGLEGRSRENGDVILSGRRESGPVVGGLDGVYSGVLWWRGHEEF
jgi:hypothetical protein